MTLKLYHDDNDSKGAEITAQNPDEIKEAVTSGGGIDDVAPIWMESDSSTLTYENIEVEKDGNGSPTVTITYSATEEGTYTSKYEPSDGDYDSAHKFWRKVVVTNITEPFERDDINHQVKADEYLA